MAGDTTVITHTGPQAASALQIPDLRHIVEAMRGGNVGLRPELVPQVAELILETWQLAHALLTHIRLDQREERGNHDS